MWRRLRSRPGRSAAVLVGLFLLALLAGWLLRPKDAPQTAANPDRTLSRFREAQRTGGGEGTGTAGAPVPAAGVYLYAARGFERARALETATHRYPRRATVTVQPAPCGFSLRLDLLDARWTEWRLCAARSAWTFRTQQELHQFFGRRDERMYRCRPRSIRIGFPARDGNPGTPRWSSRCAIEETTQRQRGRVTGVEPVTVAGRRIAAVRVRIETELEGKTVGAGVEELWLDPRTGLPLRWTARNDNTTDDILDVPYRERWDLRLLSLQPQR